MLDGGLAPRPPVGAVVAVEAVEEGCATACPRRAGEDAVQLALAEVAAVGGVLDIALDLELMGLDDLHRHAAIASQRECGLELLRRQRWRAGDDARGARAEDLVGHGQDQGAVDTTGVRHQHALQRPDLQGHFLQALRQLGLHQATTLSAHSISSTI